MKRQRNTKVAAANDGNATKAAPKVEGANEEREHVGADHPTATKRKARKQVEEEEEAVKGGGGEAASSVVAAVAESLVGLEEWPWARGVVDEQMSWGYISLPHWDLELLKGKAHTELYSDDCWDDDIWGLKAINQIPNDY